MILVGEAMIYNNFDEISKLPLVKCVESDANIHPLHDESVTVFLTNGYRLISTKSILGQSLELEPFKAATAQNPILKAEIYHQVESGIPKPKDQLYQEIAGKTQAMKSDNFSKLVEGIVGAPLFEYLKQRHQSIALF